MQTIKLAFADVPNLVGWSDPQHRRKPSRSVAISKQSPNYRLVQWLEARYDVVYDDTAPDYLIYSVFGNNHLHYPDAVRIFFTGENVRPDFNLCDYAFGYDWLTLGDRYYRAPNYVLYDHFLDLCTRRRSMIDAASSNRLFCNFIYTNRTAHPFRDEFFHRLNQYRRVDSPGAHLNNMGARLGTAYHGDWSREKVEFQQGYKFSFAFENSSTPGYTTEKIVHALAADSIPIYFGNPEVAREFNPRRFINCHEFDSPDQIVDRVMELDRNETLYRAVLAEPFFPEDRVPTELQEAAIMSQFERIFSQPKERAFRRNFHAWGIKYEERMRRQCRAAEFLERRHPFSRLARVLSKLSRRS